MAKARRYNSAKIARQPLLKKRMAYFCAQVDAKHTKPDIIEILAKGHRGYISFSEDALCKEFDAKLNIIRDKYSIAKPKEDKRKTERFYYPNNEFEELELFYSEGVSIANEVFEEKFLA